MNYKELIHKIHNRQLDDFYPLENILKDTKVLPNNRRGLYWLWTKLDYDELVNVCDKNDNKNEKTRKVPLSKLISQRKELSHICSIVKDDFKIVYNGIGGYKTNSKGFGLRERILQEYNSKDNRTGSLDLKKYNFSINDWAVSFFDFDDVSNKEDFEFLKEDNAYLEYASDLEKIWRLEFGHPILCRY